MRNRSLVKRISRMLLACMVAVLALGIALPAQAHHKDKKQNNRLKKLENKTSELKNGGNLYEGVVYAFNVVNFDCIDDDDAKFYEFDSGSGLYWLECESFATMAQSVDALTTNRANRMEALKDAFRDRG